jgi:hypothetical protein
MRTRGFPVLVDVSGRRVATGLRAAATEKPVMVALRLRERGWDPYKVSFDSAGGAWIALAFDSKDRKLRAGAA